MTAIVFSRGSTPFSQKFALSIFNTDLIEELMKREEKNLKMMHAEFIDALTLNGLQLKLINALQHLLALLSKPNFSFQELMQQIAKISNLYQEIDSELNKADRHKLSVTLELQAQEKIKQDLLFQANLLYERIQNHIRKNIAEAGRIQYSKAMLKKEEAAYLKEEAAHLLAISQERENIKEVLINLGETLGFKVLCYMNRSPLALRKDHNLPKNQDYKNLSRLLDEYNSHVDNSTIRAHINKLFPRPPRGPRP